MQRNNRMGQGRKKDKEPDQVQNKSSKHVSSIPTLSTVPPLSPGGLG